MHTAIEEIFRIVVGIAAQGIEALAVAIILAGVVVGSAKFLLRRPSDASYNQYKEILGKALLLGLNVLVAADIVRTVALEPTIVNILGLGLLVLVRTFLSWSLFVELEERWPWQIERRSASKETSQ
jgi:uncharacterized membrane protein